MRYSLLFLILISIFNVSEAISPQAISSSDKGRIIVNNRILAKVNGKMISTHDVMKKMDMLFYKQFPEYTSSSVARFKFYSSNWKSVLDDLVNKELILADADEHKVEVTGGDVRQEMENMFGPNIIENLEKAGMTFEEASEILKGELILHRMVSQNIHTRAIRMATPIKTRQAYDVFITKPENIKSTEWRFRVITVKDKNNEKAAKAADICYQLLNTESISPDELLTVINERKLVGRRTKITVSGEIINNDKELSDAYKDVLISLESGMISPPSAQKSRDDQSAYRIFCVSQKTPGGVAPFKDVEAQLKDKVLGDIVDAETDLYIERLRKHFHMTSYETIPNDYVPFILK